MAKAAPRRRPILWLVGAVFVVVILVVVALLTSPGATPSTTTKSTSTSSTGTATTTTTCGGQSSSAVVTTIVGGGGSLGHGGSLRTTTVGTTGNVSEGVPCADGQLGTVLTYQYGQPIVIQVTVPDSLTPISIQTVLDGTAQNTNPWNVTSTGHTYLLEFGGAGKSPLTGGGVTHDLYSIVTFSDNSTASSNVVYFTVYGAPI